MTKRLDGEVANLTVVIDGPGPFADVGVPFTLSASLGDAIGPFVYIWTCSALGTTHTATWTVRLLAPGPQRFSLEVGDAADDVGWANLSVNVTEGPLLAAEPVNRSADDGVPLGVALSVGQGVAPYRVQWGVDGDASSGGEVTLSTAGTVTEPLWTNATGPVWVTANVTDAVGGTDATATWASQASAPPTLALGSFPSPGEVGVPVHVSAAAMGGTPPISWTVGALSPVGNASPAHGILPGAGTISWNATPELSGELTVWVTTLDALGVYRSVNGSLAVVGPVNVSLSVVNRSLVAGAAVNLSGLIEGGVAPYTVDWSASNGAHGSGAVVVPGPVNWTVAAATAGFLTIELTVHDGVGGSFTASTTVFVAAAGTSPTPPAAHDAGDATGWILPLGLSGGAAAVGVWWWRGRRRARAGDATAHQARADRLVTEATRARNGIDADDLHGLGDAQSLFPEEVSAAVDRLVAAGRVRAEYETGESVYFWVNPATEGTADLADGPTPPEEP